VLIAVAIPVEVGAVAEAILVVRLMASLILQLAENTCNVY
jgi:hypothetical protein